MKEEGGRERREESRRGGSRKGGSKSFLAKKSKNVRKGD